MSEQSSSAEEAKLAVARAAIAAVAARHDQSTPPFNGDQTGLEQLERMVLALQASAAKLASFPMTNANEPVTTFVARAAHEGRSRAR